jgi:hypothetical protein
MDLNYLSDDENEENGDNNENDENDENDDYNYYTSFQDLNSEEYELLSPEEKQEIFEYEELIKQKILIRSATYETYSTLEIKPIQKSIENKTKKSISLNDLQEKMDAIIESTKPKKFISSRTQDRKKPPIEKNINEIKTNRKFNGRLVPYFKSDKYKNLMVG